jgi:transketolase
MRHLRDLPVPSSVPFGAPIDTLAGLARDLRYQIIQLSHDAGTPHLGSALSCLDILVAAYWRALRIDPSQPDHPDRDRFILSKGHAASALYAVLAARGFFPESLLDGYARPGSPLAEQPAPNCAPGVELATGSLGHGLPVGIGMALAARLHGRNSRVFALLSDGECNEGSVWEAAMFAPAQKLGRLIVIVDYNKWQATGRSNEVMSLHSLADKWRAFGWNTSEVDGHDLSALVPALSADFPAEGAPTALIAHTVKGRGVSFMEDDNNWHYRIPSADELTMAAAELSAR